MFDPKDWTYGYEIEWGDIPREFGIPEHLGSWEYAETDILNLRGEHALKACDPLGIDPPVGGEINTKPTRTWEEQVDRVLEIRDMFREAGYDPTSSLINHGHLHVFIPGLKEDINALHRLTGYIFANQQETVAACYGYYDDFDMKGAQRGAKTYLKHDGGRMLPEYMANNILTRATDFESYIKMHAAGKDGVSMGRPFRYAINTYCMKHTGTVEFRCFRSSVNRVEIESQFRFVEKFMDAALNGGPSVTEILDKGSFIFPPYLWNKEHWDAWAMTKWDKSRGTKRRQFYKI